MQRAWVVAVVQITTADIRKLVPAVLNANSRGVSHPLVMNVMLVIDIGSIFLFGIFYFFVLHSTVQYMLLL